MSCLVPKVWNLLAFKTNPYSKKFRRAALGVTVSATCVESKSRACSQWPVLVHALIAVVWRMSVASLLTRSPCNKKIACCQARLLAQAAKIHVKFSSSAAPAVFVHRCNAFCQCLFLQRAFTADRTGRTGSQWRHGSIQAASSKSFKLRLRKRAFAYTMQQITIMQRACSVHITYIDIYIYVCGCDMKISSIYIVTVRIMRQWPHTSFLKRWASTSVNWTDQIPVPEPCCWQSWSDGMPWAQKPIEFSAKHSHQDGQSSHHSHAFNPSQSRDEKWRVCRASQIQWLFLSLFERNAESGTWTMDAHRPSCRMLWPSQSHCVVQAVWVQSAHNQR